MTQALNADPWTAFLEGFQESGGFCQRGMCWFLSCSKADSSSVGSSSSLSLQECSLAFWAAQESQREEKGSH